MIEFRFSGLRTDRARLEHPADVFVGVSADFEIVSGGNVVYSEPDFPVVELAAELAAWLHQGFLDGADFEFDSMSTPEAGWVWFRKGEAGWRVGSVHQERADLTVLSDDGVRATVIEFITRVTRGAAEELGADVSRYLESQAT